MVTVLVPFEIKSHMWRVGAAGWGAHLSCSLLAHLLPPSLSLFQTVLWLLSSRLFVSPPFSFRNFPLASLSLPSPFLPFLLLFLYLFPRFLAACLPQGLYLDL